MHSAKAHVTGQNCSAVCTNKGGYRDALISFMSNITIYFYS